MRRQDGLIAALSTQVNEQLAARLARLTFVVAFADAQAAMTALERLGYEPHRRGDDIVLVNCPFHRLAQPTPRPSTGREAPIAFPPSNDPGRLGTVPPNTCAAGTCDDRSVSSPRDRESGRASVGVQDAHPGEAVLE